MIIKILTFIIFLSSMWFMMKIRNNRDLLTLKVFGFQILKFFLLAITSFVLGCLILLFTILLLHQYPNFMKKLNQIIQGY